MTDPVVEAQKKLDKPKEAIVKVEKGVLDHALEAYHEFGKTTLDSFKGIACLAMPILDNGQTLRGAGNALLHPIDTLQAMGASMTQPLIDGDYGVAAGRIAGFAADLVIGEKGASLAVKSGKAARLPVDARTDMQIAREYHVSADVRRWGNEFPEDQLYLMSDEGTHNLPFAKKTPTYEHISRLGNSVDELGHLDGFLDESLVDTSGKAIREKIDGALGKGTADKLDDYVFGRGIAYNHSAAMEYEMLRVALKNVDPADAARSFAESTKKIAKEWADDDSWSHVSARSALSEYQIADTLLERAQWIRRNEALEKPGDVPADIRKSEYMQPATAEKVDKFLALARQEIGNLIEADLKTLGRQYEELNTLRKLE